MLDGSESSGGSGDENAYQSAANVYLFDMFFYFGGEVDDVAETSGLLGDFVGVNRDHANELLSYNHDAARPPLRYTSNDRSFCLTDALLGSFQRRIKFSGIFAARLREVRTAAATPAEHAGQLLDNVAGVVALGEFLAYAGNEVDVGICDAGKNDDTGAELFLELVRDVTQLLAISAFDLANQHTGSIHRLFFREQIWNLVLLQLAAQFFDFFFQFPLTLKKFLHFVDCIVGSATHKVSYLFQPRFVIVNQIQSAFPGEGLDPAHPGGHAAFEMELEETDLA